MSEQPVNTSPAAVLQRGAERPARLVRMICQMILGAGMAITMILKVYMAVLTDHACVADEVTLGNAIRCSPTLIIMAYALAISAGLDLAYRLFVSSLEQTVTPVVLAFGATLLFVLGGISENGAGWREALVVIAMTAALSGMIWMRNWLKQQDEICPPERRLTVKSIVKANWQGLCLGARCAFGRANERSHESS